MASPIGAVYVELGADTAQFKAGLKDAQNTAKEFGREMTRASAMATHNARNLAFQLVDIGQSIPLAFQSPIYALQNLGFQMAQIGQIYAGQGGMRQALTDTAGLLGGVARSAGPAIVAVGAIAGALLGMTHEINAASDVTVTFGDVALASFQVIRDAITGTLAPAVESIAPMFKSVWDAVVSGTVAAGNALINAMRIAGEAIATVVRALPAAFTTAWSQIKFTVLSTIADMAGAVDRFIYGTISAINEAFGTELAVPRIAAEAYGSINAMANDALESGVGAAESVSDAWEKFQAKAAEIAASDPLGAYFEAVSAQAQAIAGARQVAEAAGGGGGGRRGRGAAEGATKDAVLRFRELKSTTAELSKEMSLAREATGGFFRDFTQGLRSGEGAWMAFANAAVNALDRITDKLLNDVLDALFQVGNAGGGGGWLGSILGGIFGGVAGGIGGVPFSSNYGPNISFGGQFAAGSTAIRFARGGVVGGPTMFPMARGMGLMGEAGPEAILPLRRGSSGRLGVEMAGGGGKVVISLAPGLKAEFLDEAARQSVLLDQRSQADTLQRVPAVASAGFQRRPALKR